MRAPRGKISLAPAEDWNGPDGPGFNQRFIGAGSAALADAGDEWEIDFPLTYVRK